MRFLPLQQPKYYKKIAFLTDSIALLPILYICLNLPIQSFLILFIFILLNIWVWISGPLFTKLGEWIIKNREEPKA